MNRRQFLKTAAGATLASPSFRLWAAPAAQSRFVLVLLRGGYDAASLLIPYQSGFYYEARPNIAIARPGAGADASLALDGNWALHPALARSIHPLYLAKQVAFIPFAGSQDKSRSHFHAQDILELGQGYDARVDYGSGFLNRAAGVLVRTGGGGVSFTENLPLVFKGKTGVANLGVKRVDKHALNPRQSDLLDKMYEGTSLGSSVHDGLQTRRQTADELQQEMVESARGAGNAKNFEQQARRMARLMLDHRDYAIGFVDVGGWDTHVHQGAARGALSDRLRDLGDGLAGFAQEMGPAWRDTIVVVVSEFGRTFRENGDKGTDHGHGSVIWVLGGGIAGGRVAGEQAAVSRDTLFQDRDFTVMNEYRSMLGYVFSRQFGFGAADLQYVFPGAASTHYAFI